MLRTELRCLNGMSWRRVGWLFGIAFGFAIFSAPADFVGTGTRATWSGVTLNFFNWFVIYLFSLGPILVALTIADNLPFTGTKRVAALAIALLLGAQFQWPLACTLNPWSMSACDDFPSFLWRSWKEMWGAGMLWTIAVSTPIALTYFWRRHDQHIAQALFEAELARVDIQRKTLETDLQAMQARVEPTFLFDTLGDIADLFDRDRSSGARMLDEMICYLRAALPDMRATRSTLKQEIALTRSYLAIQRIRGRDSLSFEINIPADLESAVAPPMIILPIVAATINEIRETDTTATSIRLDVTAEGERIRIAIIGQGPAIRALTKQPVLHDVRERLLAMYGDRTSLAAYAEAGHHLSVMLEMPRENT